MSKHHEENQGKLAQYAILYVKVGRIELALRELIPATLRHANSNQILAWKNFLTFNIDYKNTLRANSEGIKLRTNLPFSFWTSLFSYKNFQNLWVPYLSSAFPNLKNPHSKRSFQSVNKLLFESRKIRNRVAHFDFSEGVDVEADARNLDELLRLLGR